MSIIIDKPEHIAMFALLTYRGRLHLELRGMGFRQPTVPALRRMGITTATNRWLALCDLNRHIREVGGPHDRGSLALQKRLVSEGKKAIYR